MAINTQKFLPSSKGAALSKVNNIIKGSSSIGFTNKSVENLGIIRIKVIKIDDILKGTLAADKKKLNEEKTKNFLFETSWKNGVPKRQVFVSK